MQNIAEIFEKAYRKGRGNRIAFFEIFLKGKEMIVSQIFMQIDLLQIDLRKKLESRSAKEH